MEFLNNIWITFSTENEGLMNLLLIPSSFIEMYVVILLFISFLNIYPTRYQKFLCVTISGITASITNFCCLSPYNIFINYIVTFFAILYIFKLKPLSVLSGMLISIVTFTLVGYLLLNPYLKLLNISYIQAQIIPIYRIPYLLVIDITAYFITFIVRKFRLYISFFDCFNKKNKTIFCVNILLGLFTFLGQTFFLFKYVDNLSIVYTIFTFISLLSYFMISIYSLSRMAKLMITTLELQSAEEYNKSLSVLYDNVKGFKHNFDNIVSTIGGYIQTDDMDGLKKYFIQFQKDCQRTNNIATLNPSIINNPGIYSLLNSKYHKADTLGIQINLDFFVDLNDFNIDTYEFSRILGILLDNAIESASECENKIINIRFRNEEKKNRHIVTISNTYNNKDVNIDNIFNKGESGKSNHSGLGLYEVRNYLNKNNNLNLYTTKSDEFFTQQLEIYYSNNLLSKALMVIN